MAFDHFSPSVSDPSAYRLAKQDNEFTVIDATIKDDSVSEGGKIGHTIRLSPDNYVEQNTVSYSTTIPCVADNTISTENTKEPKPCDTSANLEGTAETTLTSRGKPDQSFIDQIRKTIENEVEV